MVLCMENEIRYKWAEIIGSPGKLMMISKEKLNIDHAYQRPLNSNRVILSYASKWDWALCGTLLVADRGGIFYVMDGQQRHAAAKKRSDVTDLPCMCFQSKGIAWESEVFWKFNTINKKPSPHQIYKSKLEGQDKVASELNAYIKERGYEISKNKGKKDIDCVGTLLKYFKNFPETAKSALDICILITNGEYKITHDLYIGAATIVTCKLKLDSVAIKHLQNAGEIKINREIINQKLANDTQDGRFSAKAILKIANAGRKEPNRVHLCPKTLFGKHIQED